MMKLHIYFMTVDADDLGGGLNLKMELPGLRNMQVKRGSRRSLCYLFGYRKLFTMFSGIVKCRSRVGRGDIRGKDIEIDII